MYAHIVLYVYVYAYYLYGIYVCGTGCAVVEETHLKMVALTILLLTPLFFLESSLSYLESLLSILIMPCSRRLVDSSVLILTQASTQTICSTSDLQEKS